MSKSFISDLSSTPASNTDLGGVGVAGSNLVSTGDNAMRALGSMLAMLYADLGGVNTVGGSATAVTVTTAEAWTAYGSSDGQIKNGTLLAIKIAAAATGAATLNVNSIGTKAIERQGDTAIQANDWLANAIVLLRYDTAYNSAAGAWVLMNPAALPTNGGKVTGLLDLSGAAAGQLKFPATQNPSSDANTMDDYSEGSWTPTLTFGGASTGITFSAQSGRYVKIGKLVFIEFNITLSSKGTATGVAKIAGFPFTSDSAAGGSFGPVTWLSFSSITSPPFARIDPSATTATLIYGTTGVLAPADTNFGNTTQLSLAGVYQSAS